MIAGPRVRAEWTLTETEMPFLSGGTEITLGAGSQYDDVRKEQSFALLEIERLTSSRLQISPAVPQLG